MAGHGFGPRHSTTNCDMQSIREILDQLGDINTHIKNWPAIPTSFDNFSVIGILCFRGESINIQDKTGYIPVSFNQELISANKISKFITQANTVSVSGDIYLTPQLKYCIHIKTVEALD